MCCSNWNGCGSWNGWNGRRCTCRCVCWGPYGTQPLSDNGSTAAPSAASWPGCTGADWSAAGTSGWGCNG